MSRRRVRLAIITTQYFSSCVVRARRIRPAHSVISCIVVDCGSGCHIHVSITHVLPRHFTSVYASKRDFYDAVTVFSYVAIVLDAVDSYCRILYHPTSVGDTIDVVPLQKDSVDWILFAFLMALGIRRVAYPTARACVPSASAYISIIDASTVSSNGCLGVVHVITYVAPCVVLQADRRALIWTRVVWAAARHGTRDQC